MTNDNKIKQSKQKQLNQDYADFLVEYETARGEGRSIGGFIEWRHANDRDGIKIPERKEK